MNPRIQALRNDIIAAHNTQQLRYLKRGQRITVITIVWCVAITVWLVLSVG